MKYKICKSLAIANLLMLAITNGSENIAIEKSVTRSQYIKVYIPKAIPVKELSIGNDSIYCVSETGIVSIPNSESRYITIPQVNKQYTKYSPKKKNFYPLRDPLYSNHIGGWLRGDGDYVLTPIPESDYLVLNISYDKHSGILHGFSLIEDYVPLTLQEIALRTFKQNESRYILSDIESSLPEEIIRLIKS